MTQDHLDGLKDLLAELRAVDTKLRVSGSKQHGYLLGPTVAALEIEEFEAKRNVRLPDDYRRFLLLVGNGGAGPYYGLFRLTEAAVHDLSRPFPFTRATPEYPAEELESYGDWDQYPGVLQLAHEGCGIFDYLVVNGPTYGMMWSGRENFYPEELTFGAWYRGWAECALRTLANDALVSRLRVGLRRGDVIAEVPAEWKQRTIGDGTTFFEAPEIPAQLVLDNAGVVIKVLPWPSIYARASKR